MFYVVTENLKNRWICSYHCRSRIREKEAELFSLSFTRTIRPSLQ